MSGVAALSSTPFTQPSLLTVPLHPRSNTPIDANLPNKLYSNKLDEDLCKLDPLRSEAIEACTTKHIIKEPGEAERERAMSLGTHLSSNKLDDDTVLCTGNAPLGQEDYRSLESRSGFSNFISPGPIIQLSDKSLSSDSVRSPHIGCQASNMPSKCPNLFKSEGLHMEDRQEQHMDPQLGTYEAYWSVTNHSEGEVSMLNNQAREKDRLIEAGIPENATRLGRQYQALHDLTNHASTDVQTPEDDLERGTCCGRHG